MTSVLAGRRALVTGGGRGIGRAIAEAFVRAGARTVVADISGADKAAVEIGEGMIGVECDVTSDESVAAAVAEATHALGGLDVLVNNAGVGIGAQATEHQTKYVDMQVDVNLRAIIIFYRECLEMLSAAGAEHGSALVVNMASMAGKSPQPWLSVYAATKAAVIAYTRAMNKEVAAKGVKSVAFCPGFVDTDMSDFIKQSVPAEEMLRPSDIGEGLRFLLRVSPMCVIPEIVFERPGEAI
jgi:NAD(P)-dependent dehydrogenase (short-subunit alcohol dehydrogenase family)